MKFKLRTSAFMSTAAPKTSVVKLPHAWFIMCRSKDLGRGPKAVVLHGTPLVLFRNADGKPTALLDRCPHRNVPLSLGRVTENCELECAYHGWKFDGSGACTFVPGMASDSTQRLKSRAAEPYAAVESDGFIWVYSSPHETPKSEPFRFPRLDDSHYSTVRKTFTVRGSVHSVIENTLDVPHTAFLHGGLFRTAEKKNEIEVVVRRYAQHAEAEYLGEPAPRGMVGRMLAPQGGIVTHFDRFLLPSIAQVEYRLGEKSHLINTTATTPIDDYLTQVWAVVTFRLPVPHFLVKPFVMPVVQKIFAQDAKVLEAQTQVIQKFGTERYTSTELDVLGHEIFRLMSEHANGVSTFDGVKEHRLKMRT